MAKEEKIVEKTVSMTRWLVSLLTAGWMMVDVR